MAMLARPVLFPGTHKNHDQTTSGHLEKLRRTKSRPKTIQWLQIGTLQKLGFFKEPISRYPEAAGRFLFGSPYTWIGVLPRIVLPLLYNKYIKQL